MAGHLGAVTANARFEAIYAEHAAVVYRYALRRMGRGEAEDVVAEVFLTAWRRLEDVPAQPRGWLLGVARRIAANTRRSEERRAKLRELLAAERPAPDEPPGGSSRLAQALLGLSDADREALTLIAWDGLSHREAAQVLGVREGTFAVRLSRARRRLARALARLEEPKEMTTVRLESQ